MAPKEKPPRRGAPFGLHPAFRQVYAERLVVGTEGAIMRVGLGSIVPEMGDNETTRRVVTDVEFLIDPPAAAFLAQKIQEWLAELPPEAGGTGDAAKTKRRRSA